MNPQYLLEILVKTRVTIVLETDMEYDDNERYTSGEDSNDEEEDDSDNENDGRAIGFYLLRANGILSICLSISMERKQFLYIFVPSRSRV